MLDFIYTGGYEPAESGPGGRRLPVQIAGARGDPNTTGTGNALFFHLRMNAIAGMYDVYQLREMTVHKIRHILTDSWDIVSPLYPAFLEEAFRTTEDVALHMLLVEVTVSHLDQLRGSVFGGNTSLEVPPWFYSTVLERSQESVVKIREVLSSADQMWQSLTERLENMLKERGY